MAYPVLEAAECKGAGRRGDVHHQNKNHRISRIEMHNLLRVNCRQRNDGLYPCLIEQQRGKKTQQVTKLTDVMKRSQESCKHLTSCTRPEKMRLRYSSFPEK